MAPLIVELGRRYPSTHITPVPTNLSGLPLELQVQILSLLEWKDILRVRKTCRRLYTASLARPVWLSLFKYYSATAFPRPFCLEKPLDLYVHGGLEELVLRREKATVRWTHTRSKNIPIQRRFVSPQRARDCVYLVEGGRWLLFGTRSGNVLYHDLNASITEPSMLVPSPYDEEMAFDEDLKTQIQLSVDMDLEAEYLTFNLGVITRRMPADDPNPDFLNPPYFRWIQVWRIISDVDNDGEVKGLLAERLACFPEHHRNPCYAITLYGQCVAYSLRTSYRFSDVWDGPCVIVVDWTLADPASLVYPRKAVWQESADWLALLPRNKLLCHSHNEFRLFDLDDIPMINLNPSQCPHHLSPTPSVAELPLAASEISRPYFLRNSTRVSVLTRRGVRGVIIPDVNGNVIVRVDLLSTNIGRPKPNAAVMAYDRALVSRWPDFTTVRYAWPDDEPCRLISEKTIDLTTCEDANEGRWPNVLLDESSGRIIFSIHETKKELLLDIGSL